MIVLQLGPYPPPHGGVQTNLVAIRDHLRRHGASSPVINLTRHRRTDSDGVYYPRTALAVVKLLLTIPADVIHLHIGGRFTARLLALCLFCSWLPRRRVVLTLHSGGYPSFAGGRHARRGSLPGFVLRRLDAVIAVNAEIAALFQRFGVDRSRIERICPYAPVSVRADVPIPEELRLFRASHRPLLTTVGLLEPEYDLALQIKALAEVRRSFPEAGLVIIGSGSLEPELRRLIASEPEGRHVLVCGDVPHPLTVRVIADSDVFLRTTLYDGDSVSVREALQLGIPVIATDNGMRPAGVHLIPRSDGPALCRAIAAVLQGPPGGNAAAPDDQHLDEVLALYARLGGRGIRVGQPRMRQFRSSSSEP
jgi:glycogen(starch) synthase